MDNSTTSTLLIKNVPKSISDITKFLPHTPKEIKSFGKRRVLITYENEAIAQTVLQQAQQLEFSCGKPLKAAFFCKNEKPPVANLRSPKKMLTNKTTQTNLHKAGGTAAPDINKYVSKLYACNAKLNFKEPPPPYLKYAYPRITPDIMDSISIALMSNMRFYTQVLHLMNRMNLEPPFGTKSTPLQTSRGWPRDASTQTEEDNMFTRVNKAENMEESSAPAEISESELESPEEVCTESRAHARAIKLGLKRKATSDLKDKYKKKARQLLLATLQQQKQSNPTEATHSSFSKSSELQNVFEQPETASKVNKIALKLAPEKRKKPVETFVPPTELSTKRLTVKQLQELPIYKNYQIGVPSNKLYIKNLAKEVCEEDLKQLYARFVTADCLDIKVMQQGRMKGQAFVTFNGLSEVDLVTVVAKALSETNGFVLRQKPMVVCYGKKYTNVGPQLGLLETIYADEEPGTEKNNYSYFTKLRKPHLSLQPYKYLICMDFEATCWENQAPPKWREAEIIEFPAVLVNLQSGKIEAEFHKYVMPIESPKLSTFCSELTGIKQQSVDNGMPLQTAIMLFQEWLRKELRTRNLQLPKMSKDKLLGNCAFVTWTDWDFGICLAKECQRKRLKKPTYFNQWIDLRAIFREWYKYKPINFADALSHVGLVFEGREHSGRDDARNLATLAYKLTCDGAPLAITKDIAPFQLNSNCIL